MPIETLDNRNNGSIQENLMKLKNSIQEQKESKRIPWKFEYIKSTKDSQNRNRKLYSYTFLQWWTIWWVADKRKDQMWWYLSERIYTICDKNWNEIKRNRFSRWETIFIKVSNTDIIDPTPEMSLTEINKLSNNEIIWIFKQMDNFIDLRLYHDINWIIDKTNANIHEDKKWTFIKIKNKKLYINNIRQTWKQWAVISCNTSDQCLNYIVIWIQKWSNIQGIKYERFPNKWHKNFEKWTFKDAIY